MTITSTQNLLVSTNFRATTNYLIHQKNTTASTNFVKNEYLKVVVTAEEQDLGRFAIETVEGSPSHIYDNFQSLIYGRPTPWSSYTTIYIDQKPFIFGGSSLKTQKRTGTIFNYGTFNYHKIINQQIHTSYQFDEVEVIQQLSLIRNPMTKIKDTALIKYKINNHSITTKNVGLRLMLDTKLGQNDGAPFRIGSESITSEIMFEKNKIQDYWQTFDSLTSPNVIAQGILRNFTHNISPPDRLILSNWGSLIDQPWDFNYQKGRPFIRSDEIEKDTALALYWDSTTIHPNSSIIHSTAYGLGGVTLSPGELSLGLTFPSEIIQSSTKPFLILGYVVNSGGFDAFNTTVEIKLPKGLKIASGQLKKNIGTLKSNDTYQIPIYVKPSPKIPIGKKIISIKAQSNNLETNKLNRQLDILTPPKIDVSLTITDFNPHELPPKAIVRMQLQNKYPYPLHNIEVQLSLPNKINLTPFEISQKTINRLPANDSVMLSWFIQGEPHLFKNKLHANIKLKSKENPTKYYKKIIPAPSYQPNYEFTVSKSKLFNGDYFYVNLYFNHAFKFNNRSFYLSFDSQKLKLLHFSPSSWVRESNQLDNIKINNQTITLSKLSNSKYVHQLPVIKLFFKSKETGKTMLQLSSETKTLISKSILIEK